MRSVLQVVSTAERVGVSGVVSLLARGLKRRGVDVRVTALRDGALIQELEGHGIPGDVIPVARAFDPGAIRALARRLAAGRFDVVHTHGQRAMFVGNLAARWARVPAVVTSFHELSSVKATTTRRYQVYSAIEGWLSRVCTDACVATSGPVLDDAVRVRRVPAEKLVEIHNAVDWEKFREVEDAETVASFRRRIGLDPGEAAIGALGSLVPVKGHRDLISALALLGPRVPRVRLVIAGVGPLLAALQEHARAQGVADRVIFAGDVAEPHLLYHGLDVFALPSLAESTPLVVLEAIACGVPVVATAVGGVPDLVVSDRTGLLVPPQDPQALATALARVLDDPALASRLTLAATAHARAHFAPEAFVSAHVALYERLLSGGVSSADVALPDSGTRSRPA